MEKSGRVTEQQKALEALAQASELYERYLAITRLDVTTHRPDPLHIDSGLRSWSQPLGIHFVRTDERHAVVD
jgi:hypothetical protein